MTPSAEAARVWRLSDPKEFEALRTSRHRARRGPVAVAWVQGDEGEPPRVGYALGKRIGGAVARNRLRRRLRAVVSECRPGPGRYLISAQPPAASMPTPELRAVVSEALQAVSQPAPTPCPDET